MSSHGDHSSPPPSQTTNCDSLIIRTQIASPVPAIISKLTVGDMLDIVLVPPRGPVQLVTSGGDIAGALLPIDITTLIQCITDGYSYKARVTEIRGGNCEVLIKPV